MNRLFAATLFLLVAGSHDGGWEAARRLDASAPSFASRAEPRDTARAEYGTLPVSFELNSGQSDARVRFLARGHGHTLFLTATAAVMSLQQPDARAARGSSHNPDASYGPQRATVSLELVNARPDALVEGLEALPGKVNYLRGADPRRWRLDIPTYARVRYREVYPGIDLVYYGYTGELQYDFIVKPGADPAAIRLRLDGADMSLDASGDLLGRIPGGEIRMRMPVLYQDVDGRRTHVEGSWRLGGSHEASFLVGQYDASRPLVIDPVLSYATYLGGRGDDNAVSIAVDRRGHAYVTGSTVSADFPSTAGAMQPALADGSGDAFVTKLNRTGTGLLYSTYFGGSGSDAATDIAVDGRGHVFVVGATQSPDFPTTSNGLQAFAGGTDAFVAQLDRSGSALVYSTFLGGSGIDAAIALALHPSGVVYLAGSTASTDFPTTAGAVQPLNAGGFDAFVASIDRTGSALRYATYLGSGAGEGAADVAIDRSGHAHIVGTTRGIDFPTTPNALQPAANGLSDEAFIAKLNRAGTALVYSTYFGRAGNEGAFAVAVDRRGQAHVAGYTNSSDLPASAGAFQPNRAGSDDGFVLKLDPAGSTILLLTYFGGGGQDWVEDIALDAQGGMYMTGTTESTDFPIQDAPQPTYGGSADAFAARLTRDGSSVVFSTFIGGNRREDGMAVAVDAARSTYVTGFTSSRNLPTTPGAFQPSYRGDRDSFVAKLAGRRLPVHTPRKQPRPVAE